MRCPCRPAWPAFLFLPFPSFSPSGSNAGFHPPGFRRCPRICPQLAHTALTGPITCFVGVRFPARFSKPHAGPHRGFSPSSLFAPYLSPTEKGGGYSQNWAVPVFWTCPQLAHTPPTGRVCGLSGVVPLPGFQNRTQGRTRAFLFSSLGYLHFPLRGKSGLFTKLGSSVLLNSPKAAPHASNGAGNPFCWYRFPISAQKSHTGAHRAEFGSHRFFLGCFGSGSAAKSRSSL